jgi:hypothetical protein
MDIGEAGNWSDAMNVRTFPLWNIVIVPLLMVNGLLAAVQGVDQTPNPNPTIIKKLVSDFAKATLSRRDDARNMESELIALGEATVLEVARVYDPAADVRVRQALVNVVRKIDSPATPGVLLRAALHDPDPEVSRLGLNCLVPYANADRDIRLTRDEFKIGLRELREGTSHRSAAWARILVKMEQMDPSAFGESLASAFAERLDHMPPSRLEHGTYLSSEALWLNALVAPMRFSAAGALRDRLRSELEARTDEEQRKWLLIALGSAGDPGVATELLRIVEDKNDKPSRRALALRAYAILTGEKSIGVLETYIDDETFEPSVAPRQFPLRIVARGELYRVRNAPLLRPGIGSK